MLLTGLGLTVLAFVTRLPYFGDGIEASDTEGAYLPVARSIREGNGFVSDFRPPGFPLVLAAIEGLGIDPIGGAAFLHDFVGILLPAVVLLIGWRFFNPWVGGLAGLLTAASPLMALTEQMALPDYLFGVLFLLGTACLAEATLRLESRRQPLELLVATGSLYGLATMLRPNGQLAFLLIPIALLVGGAGWRRWASASAISVAALAIVLAPWVVHNYVEYDEATVSTEGGVSLYGRVITSERNPPSPDSADGRLALTIFNTGAPTISVVNAFIGEGRTLAGASEAMGGIAREAIEREPDEYFFDTGRIFSEYLDIYDPGTLVPGKDTGQIGRIQRNLGPALGAGHHVPGDSPATLAPWSLAQILTQLVYLAALGGLVVLVLPFVGVGRSRIAAAVMILAAGLALLAQAMLVRFEPRFGVTFAPLLWILFSAAAALSVQWVVKLLRAAPWRRLRA